jgi:hypothetical protein
VAALLAFGGDMNARDSNGQTVLAEALGLTNSLIGFHLAALNGSKYKYKSTTKHSKVGS